MGAMPDIAQLFGSGSRPSVLRPCLDMAYAYSSAMTGLYQLCRSHLELSLRTTP